MRVLPSSIFSILHTIILAESQISEVSVFIPKQQVQEVGVNFLSILKKISPEDLLKKQLAIARIAPRLQYSNVRILLLNIDHDDERCGGCYCMVADIDNYHDDNYQLPARIGNGSDGRIWISPIRDAVDVITGNEYA